MKILHFSDRRSDQELPALFAQADVLFTTGDLSVFDFDPIKAELDQKPVFGVYGNHCVNGYMEKLGMTNLHLKVVEWQGFRLGGYQGCLRYKPTGEFQFTEEQAQADLAQFPAVDILLLHAAPRDLLDTPNDPVHVGAQAVREYVDRTQPKYIFCGHDSPSGELIHGQTTIYRTDGARLIEIG